MGTRVLFMCVIVVCLLVVSECKDLRAEIMTAPDVGPSIAHNSRTTPQLSIFRTVRRLADDTPVANDDRKDDDAVVDDAVDDDVAADDADDSNNADTADDDADDINGDDTDDDKDVFDTGEPTVQPTEYVETPTPLPTPLPTAHSGMGVSVFVVQTNTTN
jgi:hypothetical protein